jgi:hypothetical protein
MSTPPFQFTDRFTTTLLYGAGMSFVNQLTIKSWRQNVAPGICSGNKALIRGEG